MSALDQISASALSDDQIASEIDRLDRKLDQLKIDLEESGGHSGSPGEWLYERLDELVSQQQKRAP